MNDDERAQIFDQWISDHRGLLFKIVRAYASNLHDQEDLLQEISIQIWNSIPGFQSQSAITTWLYRVGLYSAIAWSKRDTMQQFKAETLVVAGNFIRVVDQPRDPRLDWLYERISELDEIDRSLALMWLDEQPYQEIATALGISTSNVGVKINRIKQRLSEALKRENQS